MRKFINEIIKSFSMRRSGTLFRKNLIIILLVATLPVLIISVSIYRLGTSQTESLIDGSHEMFLTQTSEDIKSELSKLELSVRHWSFNPLFGGYLESVDINEELAKVNTVLNSLSSMECSNTLIGKIEIYLNANSLLISNSNGFSRIMNEDKRKMYQEMFMKKEDLYWQYGLEHIGSNSTIPTALIQKIPAEASKPIGALVVHINQQSLENMINRLNPYKNGSVLLLNEGRQLIAVKRSDSRGGSDKMERLIAEEIISRHENNGSFNYKWEKEIFRISYGSFPRTGWKYIIFTPMSKLMAPLQVLSRLILGTSLITLILVVIVAWKASNRLYSPINRLLNVFRMNRDGNMPLHHKDEIEWIELQCKQLSRESQILQSKLEEKMVSLKEGFLYRLISGHFNHLSELELCTKMEQLGWSLNNRKFLVVHFQLFGLSNPEGNFSENDEQLVTFAAFNIIVELVNTMDNYEFDVVNFHDLSIGLLVHISQNVDQKEAKQQLYGFCEKIMQTLTSLLKMNVVAVCSKISDKIKNVPSLFEDARQATRFRDLKVVNQIINADEMIPKGTESVDYPFEIEREILKSIRMGLYEEASSLIANLLQELQHKFGKEAWLLQGALQLLGNIQNNILQSGYNLRKIYDGVSLFEELLQLRELEEIQKWFESRVLKPYIAEITELQDIKMKHLVESVILSLEQMYMKDISLEFCADMHEVNPFTLSRAFKKITGMNFIDYLTNLRLQKSKELLTNTNLKISDIAERVGYQVTYFNRIFRKYETMTPGQYREKLQVD